MVSEVTALRVRLGAELRAARARVYPSGAAFARALGWVQPKVSRLETGVQLPSDEDIELWVETAGATTTTRAELLAMLDAARVDYTTTKRRARTHRGGLPGHQGSLAELEARAERIAEYQPSFVPGLLQTAPYARELLTLPGDSLVSVFGRPEHEVDDLVAERLGRQHVLYSSRGRRQLVLGEAALYQRPGTLDTMRGQLDRLMAILGTARLDLGILPFSEPLPVIPLTGFGLHDDTLVLIETLSGDQRIDDPDEVELYVHAFDELLDRSETGRGALVLLERAATHHRGDAGD